MCTRRFSKESSLPFLRMESCSVRRGSGGCGRKHILPGWRVTDTGWWSATSLVTLSLLLLDVCLGQTSATHVCASASHQPVVAIIGHSSEAL